MFIFNINDRFQSNDLHRLNMIKFIKHFLEDVFSFRAL